jgi:hypothetical protein
MLAPLDLIVGMFHPWRDFFGNLPFKNFIITDPVRQQIPWRYEVIDQLKNGVFPLWNPYNFAGTPLLANIQSAVFYPLNVLFFIFSFPLAWSIYIYLSLILGFLFMFLYLRNLKLKNYASLFGSIVFALCGFNIAWLENGVLTHTLLWLPLILWSIDRKKYTCFLLALFSSFMAGHWQTFFYVFIFSSIYLILRKRFKLFLIFPIFILLSLPQLLPSLQFISLSARASDQVWTTNPGWFIPWQNLIQFISPDFFGNPSTLNYTGIFSYQEFIGYVGIPGLIFAFSALFIKRKIIRFFAGAVLTGLLFAVATPIAKIPFILDFPLVSSAMPTRLLSIIDFSLAALAAFGLNHYDVTKYRSKYVFGSFLFVLGMLWIFWPTKYLLLSSGLLLLTFIFKNRPKIIFIILIADLGFFTFKFLPFSDSKSFYPSTKVTEFLRQNTRDHSRFMTLNDEIFPPNFNIIYKLQSVNGYDPLYLKSYSDLVGGGNRIIVPKDYKNPVFNELGVKYILTFDTIDYPLVFQEGKTKVYLNPYVLPRVSGNSKIISYEPNKVVVSTMNNEPSLLVLSDMYYPGWQVYIDGVLSKILPTPYNFRSVEVPAGKHEVVFKYDVFVSLRGTR